MNSGKVIVFEGLDGAGLSTQAVLLHRFLKYKNKKSVLTKQPSVGLIGGLIRAVLKGEWKTDHSTLQMLYASDRSHQYERETKPALVDGKIVIIDRYVFSSIAFGGSGGVDKEWLKTLNSRFPIPDITFVLELDPEVAMKRASNTEFELELFEKKEMLENVRKNYRELSEQFNNFIFIDANRPIEDIHEEIKKIVSEKFDV